MICEYPANPVIGGWWWQRPAKAVSHAKHEISQFRNNPITIPSITNSQLPSTTFPDNNQP
jgi:hypothetical protein